MNISAFFTASVSAKTSFPSTLIGKTRAYEELIRSHACRKPFIIAVPLLRLKEEIANRLTKRHIYQAPSWEQLLLPAEIKENINNAYKMGYYKDAKNIIAEYAKNSPYPLERKELEGFLNWMNILEKHDQNIVMTHAQLMNVPDDKLSEFEIIIDEDYLYTMLKNTGSISDRTLETLVASQEIDADELAQIEKMLSSGPDRYYRNECISYKKYKNQKTMEGLNIYENVNSFLNADVYHRSDTGIDYFSFRKLPKQKLTILSATLDEEIYSLFFRRRSVITHEVPKVRYHGRLIQYTNHSLSRTDINTQAKEAGLSTNEFFQYLVNYIGKNNFDYGITFKEYESLLGEDYLHFGNAIGLDQYKGKNGLIIGTPHLPESCYKLLGFYLGVDVTKCKLERQRVQYGGYDFPLMSYGNDILRRLQLYLISSDLEQSIGRSGLLRSDAIVYLFSNFPCEQSEIIQDEYLKQSTDISDSLTK